MSRRQWGQVLALVVVVAALVAGLAVGGGLRSREAAPRPLPSAAGPVVLVGVPGLQPSDVDPTRTPTLWAMVRDGASATLNVTAVHPVTCPVDGWLTVSAGGRAGAADGAGCPAPQVSGGSVTGWTSYADAARARPYDAVPGLLGTTLASAGRCVSAIGPGAGVGAADEQGRVASYRDGVDGAPPRCPVGLVDGGTVTGSGSARIAAAAAADAVVARVRSSAPDADVLVAGLADDGRAGMRLVVLAGAGVEPGYLVSPSTHQARITQLPDLTATLLARTGVAVPRAVAGSALQRSPAASGTEAARDRLRALVDVEQASRSVTPVVAPLFTIWGFVAAALLLLVALARRRGWRARTRLTDVVRRVLVVLAAVPAATYLAMLLPWWRAGSPTLALLGAVALWSLLVGGAALAGSWRRSPTGPPTAVALVTLVVLVVDLLTGSRLQVASLLGLNPTVGGRFYGLGNVAFALQAGAFFVVAGTLVARLPRRPRVAAALVTLLALVVLVVDAGPTWGAKVGGPPAFAPGVALLVLLVLGVRVTWRRLLLVGGGTLLLVVAIALADWARGAGRRSHLGDYVQTLLDGGGGDVVVRKLEQNLGTLTGTSVFAYLIPVGLVLVWWGLLAPGSWVARPLAPLFRRVPAWRPALLALTLTVTIGLFVNDTGVAIPPVSWLLVAPLAAAAALHDLALRDRSHR
ncbi:hypothetical protein [Lapillicoccus jejuensis]|uniref:Uncharacterized protein n=1 Tax=Lapillicoccus jejuensis TaxID=402171 RepID=A0A542DYN3_9MICO|nr:hypothetical protein [Lapillicoccus jejuensis]TQJ08210.1 hypothetical protein FB458_1294 [Lapillicoccus jejuensis]